MGLCIQPAGTRLPHGKTPQPEKLDAGDYGAHSEISGREHKRNTELVDRIEKLPARKIDAAQLALAWVPWAQEAISSRSRAPRRRTYLDENVESVPCYSYSGDLARIDQELPSGMVACDRTIHRDERLNR